MGMLAWRDPRLVARHLALLVGLGTSLGGAAGASDPATDGVWTHFTVEDGLPELDVRCAFQDRDGTLWIATRNQGVAWHDGSSWHSLSVADGLAANGALSITQDRSGALWFAGGGVSRFHEGPCRP